MDTDEIEIKMDADSLYREEVYTDRKMGSIRIMTPVNSDGSNDESRVVLFLGQSQLMTPMGALPLVFEIEAADLAEAVSLFPECARKALDDTMEELKELRRQQASSIVTPDSPGGLSGFPSGGGNIKFP